MPSDDELYAARERAERRLAAVPDVIGVGLGAKYVGGESTRRPALVVYVRRKRTASEVPVEHRIPAEIDGVPTDVEEMGRGELAQASDTFDAKKYRPLTGGTRIATSEFPLSGVVEPGSAGTLGCMARTTPGNVAVALTAWHVLLPKYSLQPDAVGQPTASTGWCGCCSDVIGQRVSAQTWQPDMDAAYIVLDSDVEWMATIAGVGSVRGVRDVTPTEAAAGVSVRQRGMKSGPRDGVVRSVAAPFESAEAPGPMTGLVQVRRPAGSGPVARKGDSGSAVVDDRNMVVGILFGTGEDPTTHEPWAVATPIARVQSRLKVVVATNPPAVTHIQGVPSPVETGRKLERDLATTAAGQMWLELFRAHRAEVTELIARDRRVMLAWHRNSGPALLHHAWCTVYDAGVRMPYEVDGQAVALAVNRILDALHDRGSEPLRQAVADVEPLLVGLDGLTYAQLLARADAAANEPRIGAPV